MSAPRRGQTLVLFALSLLLLTLMVVLTLAFSVRVKEKIETQTVADAAAYSNAVATARTFNSIALLTRAQIAHMVAQAGANSLIAFSSLYRGHLNNLGLAYIQFMAPYPGDCSNRWSITQACSCQVLGDLGIQSFWIFSEQMRITTIWDSLDTMAGRQAAQRWNSAMALYAAEEAMYQVVLRSGKLDDQDLAKELVNRAMAGAPVADLYAPSNGDAITMREISGGLQCTGDGAACDANFLASHHVAAAMGSRGWPFTTAGVGGTDVLNDRLAKIVKPQFVRAQPYHPILGPVNPSILSAYWSATFSFPMVPPFDPTLHGIVPVQTHAKADGHGITRARYRKREMAPIWQLEPLFFPPGVPFPRGGGPMFNPLCKSDPPPFQMPAYTLLSSNNPMYGTSTHYWNFGTWFPIDFDGGARHNLPVPFPSGVWPLFVDYNYNTVDDAADVWGQPKNMAVIRRNHAVRSDPWMLRFNYRFTPAGQEFDARGFTTADGIDLSQQTALSTGIAYYHQVGQTYEQVPNLMNPYWRATLVPSNVDAQGEQDPARLLNGMGLGDAADVYTSLRAVGYKGLH